MERRFTIYEIVANLICIILLVGTVIFFIASWHSIPAQVPLHYNGGGEVDRWGGKGGLLVLPIIGFILYLGLSVVEHFPQIWNTGVTVTEENREAVYRILKNLLVTTKLLTVGVFAYLSVNSALAKPLPALFTPVFLILMFGSMLFFILKLVRAR